MRTTLLLLAAASFAVSAPALAKPGHGNGKGHENDYAHDNGGGGCPPGLAKKHNGCMPPGQARKLGRGDRWQGNYGTVYTYQRIPYDLRRRYDLNARYRYYYRSGTIYVVDPRTMLIAQVISALLR